MSTGTRPARAWFSFRRIVDVPFGTCVAALEAGSSPGTTDRLRAAIDIFSNLMFMADLFPGGEVWKAVTW
jgi:hypothetical protein